MRIILFFSLLLCLNTPALYAQKSEVGNWFIYFGNQSFAKRWNWHNEVQYRNYNALSDLEQLLLRTGIGYNLTENNNNILVGYGFIKSQRYLKADSSIYFDEHRIYQQFITRQNFGRFFLQHRYRLEERFIENVPLVRWRARYFLSINVPINKSKLEKGAVYLSAYNELFINSKSPVFDRNRVYGALGYVFHKSFRIEFGYMTQYLETRSRPQFQIVIFNNFPFPQKENAQ